MKKTIALLLCLALALALVGCGETKLKLGGDSSVAEGTAFDVSMKVVDGTATPFKATLLITNNTDLEMESGNAYDFFLEALRDGTWKTIEVGSWDNTAEAFSFVGESELEIDWTKIYGKLPGGTYRIVKSFFPWTEDGTYGVADRFYLTAEFSLE